MATTNFFSNGMDADRYARSRPEIHRTAIDKFRIFANIEQPLSRALDIACGTGQSTIALTEIAESIVGVDSSSDMLASATPHPDVSYRLASAESVPLPGNSFDLITVALAYHWLNHDKFLVEAHRLLRPRGWLVIYTSGFTSQMRENPDFGAWFNDTYMAKFPVPPRNRSDISSENATERGFKLLGEDNFTNDVRMSLERFTDYQLSTTHIIAAVQRGNESFEDITKWIESSLRDFFADQQERTFLFAGKIWYLQKYER